MAEARTVVLTVDNPMRDLAGIVLLGTELCARGHRALLVPVNIFGDAWAARPDLFVLGYHRRANDHQLRRIFQRGLETVILDTEGAPPTLDMYTGILSLDARLRARTKAVCLWGEKLTRHLLDKGLYAASQLRLTGCPRHDYFHPSLADSARTRSRAFTPGPEGFLLITGSAGVANPRFKTPEQELEDYINQSGLGREWCTGLQKEQAGSLRQTLEVTERLAADFPGVPIVLRPHPFENPDVYKPVVERHSNVTFQRGGTVDGLLLRARCLIQRTSTTAIEAALAGIPALSMHWIPIRYAVSEETESVVHPCPTYEALRDQVAAVLGGTYAPPPEVPPRVEAAIREKFLRRDGRAHERVADVLAGVLEAWDPSRKRGMSGLRFRGWLAHAARRRTLAAWKGSVKAFDASAVRTVLDSFQGLPLAEFPGLKTPVDLSVPRTFAGGLDSFRSRAVLMSPAARG